jgi:uncharacterized protein
MYMPFLTNTAARRLFLARHALGEAPVGPARGAALADLIGRIGFVQVDSINTVARAHHMILWSRRHSYRPEALKQLTEGERGLFEHWTHDASLLPIGLHPYWQHRFVRDAQRLQSNWKSWFRDGYEAEFETILRRIEAEGPVTSSDVGQGEVRGKGGWWDWHPSKTALEWLWRTGQLAVAGRNGFQKIYDLTERVIPAAHLGDVPDEATMVDWACASALDHLGFATPGEIRAYWKALRPEEARGWCAAALASGAVIEIDVEGYDGSRKRMLARPDVLDAVPQVSAGLRILSPFDPALRDRDRAEFLFGFHYRIEVFVPEPKRVYGYYVFPVLEGDQIIGRLDAKAFRDEAVLRVKAFWPEVGVKPGPQRLRRLDGALERLAAFAGCTSVEYLDGWLRGPVVR